MGYNTETAREVEDNTPLPKDSILDGIIISIQDGKVKDFVKNLTKWDSDPEGNAIQISYEVNTGKEKVKQQQVYGYNVDDQGNTTYSPKSNLGKFKKKYGRLPTVGTGVKIITNNSGFGKIKLD